MLSWILFLDNIITDGLEASWFNTCRCTVPSGMCKHSQERRRKKKKKYWKKGSTRLCPNSPSWHLPLQLLSGTLMLHYYPLLFISPRCFGWSMLSSVLATQRQIVIDDVDVRGFMYEHIIQSSGVKVRGEKEEFSCSPHICTCCG